MAESSAVVDISVDPVAERRRRRHRFLRIGLPIAGVATLIIVILLIALYLSTANRRDVLVLSDELIDTLDSRIALEVSAYLDPAIRATHIGRDMLQNGALGDRQDLAIDYSSMVLGSVPQIKNMLFADSGGNFLMVSQRAGGGTDVKIVRNTPGPRRVTWIHRDAAGKFIGQEDDPTDDFDPRTRPWYAGAIKTDDLFWTEPYVFFTDQKPGVTLALRYVAADGHPYVFGADITLDVLSNFLASLKIGNSGRAYIIDSGGRLVASPAGNVTVSDKGNTPDARKLDEIGDPIVTRAYDRFRVEGPGRHVIDINGRRYITAVAPLSSAGQDWAVLTVVPEDDFVGFIASHSRRALALALVVVAIAGALAVLLIRQGLRTDHNARLVRERQNTLDRQSAGFATLATDANLFDPGHGDPPRQLTETLADVSGARRASVWRLVDGGRRLRCDDSFDRVTNGHVDGLELHQDELRQFFVHLLNGEEIEVSNAAHDRRTADLYRVLMQPLGNRTLLAIPAKRGNAVVGTIWLEDAQHTAPARDFVRAVANMVAPRMATAPDVSARRENVVVRPSDEPRKTGERHYATELRARGIDPATIAAELYSNVAVMVLHFTDSLAMATRSTDGAQCLSDAIVRALQEVADKNDIPYLKIVGQEAVAAAGFGAADDAAASLLVADTAMAIRERCVALFEECEHPQEFRIGIDCGAAIGCTLGAGPRIFNLWGEAVRTANEMAASALPGTVQASEAAYHKLRQDFLFRPRGRFYLPRAGEAQTFILASRL